MNIEVVGRIRPSIVGEGSKNLNVQGSQRVSALTGHFFKYVTFTEFILLLLNIW